MSLYSRPVLRPSRPILALMLSTSFTIAGCMSAGPVSAPLSEMLWIPVAGDRNRAARPVVAVSLGAGAMRGLAHIGVIRAFEQAGIVPDIIVGSSIGAIIGALWAAGIPSATIELIAGELGSNSFSDWSPSIWQTLRGQFKGLAEGKEIEMLMVRHLGNRTIERLPIRFAVVTADLNTGETVRINGGSLSKAVRASAALPVALTPVEVTVNGKQRELIDGGLVEPVPVRTAHRMGADIVVAVDIGYRPTEANVRTVVDVSFQSMQIAINALRREQLMVADLVISPILHEQDISREAAAALIAEGERAAAPVLLELKKRLTRAKLGNTLKLDLYQPHKVGFMLDSQE